MPFALLPVAIAAALPAAWPTPPWVGGVRIDWPVTRTTTIVDPGSTLSVRLRSPDRRSTVSFVRVGPRGTGLRTVARRTFRSGVFTVTVPPAQGIRYELRIIVAGTKYRSWVLSRPAPATPAPAPRTPTPDPAPRPVPAAGAPAPVDPCAAEPALAPADYRAVVTPAATTVKAGETLRYTVTNAGAGRLFEATEGVLAGTQPVTVDDFGPELARGATFERELVVPADRAPGPARIAVTFSYDSCDGLALRTFESAPIEVTAP
jgi:hypothetical protein